MDGPPSLRLGVRPPPGQRISYDATSDVQMQVHLHRRKAELATLPAQRRPGNCQFQRVNAGKTHWWVGVWPQREMNRGSGAQPPAARTATGREMAEESSQQSQR